jgi:hypothetical protein
MRETPGRLTFRLKVRLNESPGRAFIGSCRIHKDHQRGAANRTSQFQVQLLAGNDANVGSGGCVRDSFRKSAGCTPTQSVVSAQRIAVSNYKYARHLMTFCCSNTPVLAFSSSSTYRVRQVWVTLPLLLLPQRFRGLQHRRCRRRPCRSHAWPRSRARGSEQGALLLGRDQSCSRPKGNAISYRYPGIPDLL